jgi:hypothetical protein
MPSIRALLTFSFPRLFGSSHEHTTSPPTGPLPVGGGISQNIAGGIQHTSSYSIEYNTRFNGNGSKFVQLVDIGGAASNTSDFSVEESVGRKETRGWRV